MNRNGQMPVTKDDPRILFLVGCMAEGLRLVDIAERASAEGHETLNNKNKVAGMMFRNRDLIKGLLPPEAVAQREKKKSEKGLNNTHSSQRYTLEELPRGGCRFPVSKHNVSRSEHLFCGEPVCPRGTYCAKCWRKAHQIINLEGGKNKKQPQQGP